jgi:MFS family permease
LNPGEREPKLPIRARLRELLELGLNRDGRILFWSMICWDFGFGLYSAFLTLYMRQLGASDLQVGVLIGVQGIVRILVTIPSGMAADHFDRRRLIIFSTGLTIPAALIYFAAGTWWHLLPGLALFMCGNIGTAAFSAYVADSTTTEERARAFAMIYTVGPAFSMILAPALGGWISDAISLRSVFLASALSYVAATVVVAGISTRPRAPHEGAGPSYREALAVPEVRAVAFVEFAVLGLAMMGVTFLPNYLEDEHGFAISTIGRLFSIAALGSVVLALAISRSRRLDGAPGIAVSLMTIGVTLAVTLLTDSLWLIAVFFLGRGGMMVAWSLCPAVMGMVTPERLRGRAFAASEFLGGVGLAIAPVIAGAMYSEWRPLPLVSFLVLAPLLAAAVLWVQRRYVRPAVERVQAAGPVVQPQLEAASS